MFKIASILYFVPPLVAGLAWAVGAWELALVLFASIYFAHLGASVVLGYQLGRKSAIEGTELALRVQAENDSWDAKKQETFARFFTEIYKMASRQPPALPEPNFDIIDLPPVREFRQ